MATGKGAFEGGETARALEKRAGERWGQLSRGLRGVLVRALHPDEEWRYRAVEEFREEILQLQDWWGEEWRGLIQQLRLEVRDAQGEPAQVEPAQGERALVLADLAERRGAPRDNVEYYTQQLGALGQGVSVAWQAGRQYYEAGEYHTALEIWQPEARAQGRVEFARWVLLAEIAAQAHGMSEGKRRVLEQLVTHLEDGDTERAQQALRDRSLFSTPEARAFKAEVELRRLMMQAHELEQSTEPSAWQAAAENFRQADVLLNELPYSAALREEEGWTNFPQRADALGRRADERLAVISQQSAIRNKVSNNPSEAPRAAAELLRRDPSNPVIAEVVLEQGERLLDKGHPEEARALLEVGVLYAQVGELSDRLRQAWQQAMDKARTKRVEDEQRSAVQALRTAFEEEQWASLRSRALGLIPFGPAALESLGELPSDMQDAFDQALARREVPKAQALAAALAVMHPTGNTERQQALKDVSEALRSERDNWSGATLQSLTSQGHTARRADDYSKPIEEAKSALALLDSDETEKREQFEKLRDTFEKKRERALSQETMEAATNEVEQGAAALRALTLAGLEEAKDHFAAARAALALLSTPDSDVGSAAEVEKRIAKGEVLASQLLPPVRILAPVQRAVAGWNDGQMPDELTVARMEERLDIAEQEINVAAGSRFVDESALANLRRAVAGIRHLSPVAVDQPASVQVADLAGTGNGLDAGGGTQPSISTGTPACAVSTRRQSTPATTPPGGDQPPTEQSGWLALRQRRGLQAALAGLAVLLALTLIGGAVRAARGGGGVEGESTEVAVAGTAEAVEATGTAEAVEASQLALAQASQTAAAQASQTAAAQASQTAAAQASQTAAAQASQTAAAVGATTPTPNPTETSQSSAGAGTAFLQVEALTIGDLIEQTKMYDLPWFTVSVTDSQNLRLSRGADGELLVSGDLVTEPGSQPISLVDEKVIVTLYDILATDKDTATEQLAEQGRSDGQEVAGTVSNRDGTWTWIPRLGQDDPLPVSETGQEITFYFLKLWVDDVGETPLQIGQSMGFTVDTAQTTVTIPDDILIYDDSTGTNAVENRNAWEGREIEVVGTNEEESRTLVRLSGTRTYGWVDSTSLSTQPDDLPTVLQAEATEDEDDTGSEHDDAGEVGNDNTPPGSGQ
jgi:hypothetical protein